MVSTGNIRAEEASDMEDFSLDDYSRLMDDAVCTELYRD
jgi:hypothetical protein